MYVYGDLTLTGSLQTTIQTHNAVSVAGGGGISYGAWIDTYKYDQIAVTFANSAGASSRIAIDWSHDGSTLYSSETPLIAATDQYRTASTPTKARYARVTLVNNDASARTMSAAVYLKA